MSYSARNSLTENAHRLFGDAKLLNDHGRYASAMALAILAIEEVGKRHLYDIKHSNKIPLKGKRFPPPHTDKQAAFTAPFVYFVQRQAMIQICKYFGGSDWEKARGSDDWEKAQDFLVEGYAVSQYDENPKKRQRALEILNIVAAFVDVRIDNHPLASLMQLARDGHIDKQKQSALYLDVEEDGTIKSDPTKLGKPEAEFWLEIALVAIQSLESMGAAEAAAEQFAKRYITVAPPREPKPSPTAEDWKALYEKLEKNLSSSIKG